MGRQPISDCRYSPLTPAADLFRLPFNISLQRGQCPVVFFAKSIKKKRQRQMGDPVEIECENKPPVDEGPTILWIECVPNTSVNIRIERASPQLHGMVKGEVFRTIVFSHRP